MSENVNFCLQKIAKLLDAEREKILGFYSVSVNLQWSCLKLNNSIHIRHLLQQRVQETFPNQGPKVGFATEFKNIALK